MTVSKQRGEEHASKSARMLYKPWGITGSLVAGLIAGQVFQQLWKKASPTSAEDPPKALESEYPMKEVLAAAVVQGAIYAVVKAIFQRVSARGFQRWTGEWPGD